MNETSMLEDGPSRKGPGAFFSSQWQNFFLFFFIYLGMGRLFNDLMMLLGPSWRLDHDYLSALIFAVTFLCMKPWLQRKMREEVGRKNAA